MQDVQRHLAVVDAGDVHAEALVPPEYLGRELGRLAEDDDPALAEGEGQALRAAGGRDLFVVVAGRVLDRRIGQLEDRDAPRRSLERGTGEGLRRG